MLDIQATGIGDYESTEPTENLVADMVVNLTKIGLHLSKQPKVCYYGLLHMPLEFKLCYFISSLCHDSHCMCYS